MGDQVIAPEPISTIVPGDRVVVPVDIKPWLGLPGIASGSEATVVESFASDLEGRWVLHVKPDAGVVRTVALSDEAMVEVIA